MKMYYFLFLFLIHTIAADLKSQSLSDFGTGCPDLEFVQPCQNISYTFEDVKVPLYNNTVYFVGCQKGDVQQHLMSLQINILRIARFWNGNFHLIVYATDEAAQSYNLENEASLWGKPELLSKITILRQSHAKEWTHVKHGKRTIIDVNANTRTERLAACRNYLLEEVKRKAGNTFDETIVVMMDLDEVNVAPFNMGVIENALLHESQWDYLAFNRDPYYDFWALRHEWYNENILVASPNDKEDRRKWERFTRHKLEFAENWRNQYSGREIFPVYSTFNGIIFLKMKDTNECYYEGLDNGYEECEHVIFTRCLREEKDLRVMQHNGSILSELDWIWVDEYEHQKIWKALMGI